MTTAAAAGGSLLLPLLHSRESLMSRPLTPAPPAHIPWMPGQPDDLLARMAQRLREVKPLDEILDDIGDVLGNQAPPAAECEDLDQRLRADLVRLTRIALATRDTDPEVSALLQRADWLLAQDIPAEYQLTLGSLRRMASTANSLLERLTETGSIKEIA